MHVPFTAPMLTGARARLRRDAIDYILPNPSGGRGSYVAGWSMVSEFAMPTLHDAMLVRRLGALPALTPASVRAAARAVACAGYAGRDAAAAASQAEIAIGAETRQLREMLLAGLLRHAGMSGNATGGFDELARRLMWKPDVMSYALEQLSSGLVTIAGGASPGRQARVLTLLRGLHAMLKLEVARSKDQAGGQMRPDQGPDQRALAALGHMLGRVEQCLDRTQALLDTAAAALEAPALLLERWRAEPQSVLAVAATIDTLLDGWERICLLWTDAASLPDRLPLIQELGLLVRIAGSGGSDIASSPADNAGAGGGQGQPHGAGEEPPLPLVERNERIRVRELELDCSHGP